MKRLFIEYLKLGQHILSKENANYIKNVLRFRSGDQLLVFDGNSEAKATYDGVKLEITEYTRENYQEPELKLAIAQIKQPRFEWLVEKATEIGISEIFLLTTKFANSKIHNLNRVRKIAIEAARQCQRVTVPKIHNAITLDEFIKQHSHENWVFGHINRENFVNQNIVKKRSNENIGIVIGPEGGFEENESKKLINHFAAISLSQNVLRAETAALVGLIYILSAKACPVEKSI